MSILQDYPVTTKKEPPLDIMPLSGFLTPLPGRNGDEPHIDVSVVVCPSDTGDVFSINLCQEGAELRTLTLSAQEADALIALLKKVRRSEVPF